MSAGLQKKKGGSFIMLRADPAYEPLDALEYREVVVYEMMQARTRPACTHEHPAPVNITYL